MLSNRYTQTCISLWVVSNVNMKLQTKKREIKATNAPLSSWYKKETQMSLLSAKEQCLCAVKHNKRSQTHSSTEEKHKALSDRTDTLTLI